MKSLELAEALRQAHCDRKTQSHKCRGVMTIGPGQLDLNCDLCGQDRLAFDNCTAVVNEAKEICKIAGVEFDSLDWSKRREMLLAIADLATRGL